jgi:hypothetical protein
LAVAGAALPHQPAAAEEATSAVLARQLTEALAARQVDAWSARDAGDSERFVAALHVPGTQLLVVSARPTAPESLTYRLGLKDHRQVYVELQSSAVPSGKFFVQDMAADGFNLDEGKGATVDVVYENVTTRTLLNGDWKAQKLTEAEYVRRRTAAESRYVAMLSSLLASMNDAPASGPQTAATVPKGGRPR